MNGGTAVIGNVRPPQVSHIDGAISKWGMTSKCRTVAPHPGGRGWSSSMIRPALRDTLRSVELSFADLWDTDLRAHPGWDWGQLVAIVALSLEGEGR